MSTAFIYRERKDEVGRSAQVGSTVVFNENTDYVLSFPESPDARDKQRIEDIGGEFIDRSRALIRFSNFVGIATIAGAVIDVRSSKVGPEGTSLMMQEISESASGLLFSWGSPTAFATSPSAEHSPVPYHQLQ